MSNKPEKPESQTKKETESKDLDISNLPGDGTEIEGESSDQVKGGMKSRGGSLSCGFCGTA